MRWLHISDLHFGYENNTVLDMREKLIGKLESIGNIDYLFITGDLRYAKNNPRDYPQDIVPFIEDIKKKLKLTNDRVFIVPGNHDVSRSKARNTVINAIKEQYSCGEGHIDDSFLKVLQESTTSFAEVYEKTCGREYLNIHYSICHKDFNIIHINTSLVCGTDNEDGTLIIGMMLLRKALANLDKTKPSIAIAHHGFECLIDEEQKALEILLKENNTILYLCGHKHKAFCKNISVMRQDTNLWEYLCGTNMDKSPHIETTDMDFFIGDIDNSWNSGSVAAYKWSRDNSDWLIDQDFSYRQGKAEDGRHYFSKQPSKLSILIEKKLPQVEQAYKNFLFIECSKMQLDGQPIDNSVTKKNFALNDLFVSRTFSSYSIDADANEFGFVFNKNLTIKDIIKDNDSGCFRIAIQAELGSGKTTLMKRLVLSYCSPKLHNYLDDTFIDTELFPIWLLCRSYDVKTSVSRNIRNIPLQSGFHNIDENTIEAFEALVYRKITQRKAVLIIDGLDEIDSVNHRIDMLEQIKDFLRENNCINILITSRVSGYTELNEYLVEYDRYDLNPFSESNISEYCYKWYETIYGKNNLKMEKICSELIANITADTALFKLAENPLLLTTLLLVHRRFGQLPKKRVDLYREAMRVLIETWDVQRGYSALDFEKTQYQLAYVAYTMVSNGNVKQLSKSEILKLLSIARESRNAWFRDQQENTEQFLNKIEQRTTLLIQRGSSAVSEKSELEALYEFRHLGFRDYLAALAIAKHFYPNAKRYDKPCDILEAYMDNPNLREMIVFSTVIDSSSPWSADDTEAIVKCIIERIKDTNNVNYENTHKALISLLLQLIADEAPLSHKYVNKALDSCLSGGIDSGCLTIYESILMSVNGHILEDYLKAYDQRNKTYSRTVMLSILKKQTDNDLYDFYQKHKRTDNNDLIIKVLRNIGIAIWMGNKWLGHHLKSDERELLANEMLNFVENPNDMIAEASLGVLDSLSSIFSISGITPVKAGDILRRISSILMKIPSCFFLMRLSTKFKFNKEVLLYLSQDRLNKDLVDYIQEKYEIEEFYWNKIGYFWFMAYFRLWSVEQIITELDELINIKNSTQYMKSKIERTAVDYFNALIAAKLVTEQEEEMAQKFVSSKMNSILDGISLSELLKKLESEIEQQKISNTNVEVNALEKSVENFVQIRENNRQAHEAYSVGNFVKAEENFLKVLELNELKDYNSTKNNLAYMKRRGETTNTSYPIFELLEIDQAPLGSAFRCINAALCYIQGFECERNVEKAINMILHSSTDIEAAYSWWKNSSVVGEAESDLVIYLLSKTGLISGESDASLNQKLQSAKSKYILPENIDDLITVHLSIFHDSL